jgi:hypothetical protein
MRLSLAVKAREGAPEGWATALVTALGSVLGKLVPRGHLDKSKDNWSPAAI